MSLFPLSGLSRARLAYRAVLLLGDLACLSAALWAGFRLRFGHPLLLARFPLPMDFPPVASSYLPIQTFSAAVLLIMFAQSGLYRRVHAGFMDELLRVLNAVAKGWLVIMAATFAVHDASLSRLVFWISAILCVLFVLSFRTAVKAAYGFMALRWWGPYRTLVIGRGRLSAEVVRVLGSHPDIVVGRRSIGDATGLAEFLETHRVREVFACEPEMSHIALMDLAEVCEERGVSFRVIPDLMELRMGEVVFDDSLGLPSFSLKPLSLQGVTFLYKRAFDISVSITLISLLFLPFLFLAFLIRLDSKGSIFFHQKRVGLKGVSFPFFKFRSMVVDAEARLSSLKGLNERSGAVFKMKKDPRVTRVGRWIRKLSVDEFPQLFNVLRGEMSLVGPRPQLPSEVAEAGETAKRRMNVLPGITGLWQVSGRAGLTYEQMIDLDTYYIEHWSPGLDLKILLRTLPAVLAGHGAY